MVSIHAASRRGRSRPDDRAPPARGTLARGYVPDSDRCTEILIQFGTSFERPVRQPAGKGERRHGENSWPTGTGRNCAKRRMLRVVSAALRGIAARATNTSAANCIASRCDPVLNSIQHRGFGALSIAVQKWAAIGPMQHKTLLNHAATENRLTLSAAPVTVPVRTVIKFSMSKGKRQTVKTVLKRFYRLNWGIWIRTRTGRHNKLWTKSASRKKRLRQHVFCNAQQSTLLDKMVCKYWRRRHYYVDDPYEPYHNREEFRVTRRKPLP